MSLKERLRPLLLIAVDVQDWLYPAMLINLLWFVLSCTVVLMPPATAALHEVAYGMYRNQAPSARAFLAGMRRWLARAWGWGAANLLLLGAVIIGGQVYGGFVAAVLVMVAALAWIAQFYFWAYTVIDPGASALRCLRNAVFTLLASPVVLVLYGIPLLIVGIPALVLIAPVMLILPLLVAMLSVYSLVHWLAHHGLLDVPTRRI